MGDAVSYNAAISSCGRGVQWQMALQLLWQMKELQVTTCVLSVPMPPMDANHDATVYVQREKHRFKLRDMLSETAKWIGTCVEREE